jgi:HK97 family phage prohead protease
VTDLLRCAPLLARAATAEDGARHLVGHFATFNRWTEIDSWSEGHFMERIAPGAFRKTFTERADQIKVLYDHGYDPTLGNKPLGSIVELDEDGTGARYDVALIDTDYNRDFIIPAADAGLLGASFRFRVLGEKVDKSPERSEHNPNGIPERTVTEVKLFEFGPVTFPAYPDGTTVGLRSDTDRLFAQILADPALRERLLSTSDALVAGRSTADAPAAADPLDSPASATGRARIRAAAFLAAHRL